MFSRYRQLFSRCRPKYIMDNPRCFTLHTSPLQHCFPIPTMMRRHRGQLSGTALFHCPYARLGEKIPRVMVVSPDDNEKDGVLKRMTVGSELRKARERQETRLNSYAGFTSAIGQITCRRSSHAVGLCRVHAAHSLFLQPRSIMPRYCRRRRLRLRLGPRLSHFTHSNNHP